MKRTVVFYVVNPNDPDRVLRTSDEQKARRYLRKGYEVAKVETIDIVESDDSMTSIVMTSKMKE